MRDRGYFEYRFLENRVKKLERLMYERSVGRSGPSIAMNIWTFLMDNGPSTKEEIDAGLGARYSNNPALNSWVKAGLITKRGDRYVADPNYVWDDVGVINRSVPPELLHNVDSIPEYSDNDVPADTTRGGRGRTPRQPRVKQVKKNLFSKKLEEVKAAVDAGEDINQKNNKGDTPLSFAARSKTPDLNIIEYLLKNGALVFGDYDIPDALYAACKSKNFDVTKTILRNCDADEVNHPAETITAFTGHWPSDKELVMLAASKEGNKPFTRQLHSRYHDARYRVKDEYSDVIHTLVNNSSNFESIDSYCLQDEIADGQAAIIDAIANKYGILICRRINSNYINKDAAKELIKYYKDAINGKLKLDRGDINSSDFIYMCNALSKITGDDIISDLLTPERISKLDPIRDIPNLLSECVYNNNYKLLDNIIKSGVKVPSYNVISYAIDLAKSNKIDLMKRMLRLLNKSADRSSVSNYLLRAAIDAKNTYLIEYLIDCGFGNALAIANYDKPGLTITKLLSNHDIKMPSSKSDLVNMQNKADDERDAISRVNYIIELIENDEWNTLAEGYISKHPELLSNDEIIEAVNNNPNSITARQLKRRIDALPKENDIYDF